MPKYIYGDANGHRKELAISYEAVDKAIVFCELCDAVMHRVPQAVAVNWGGLPPHEADRRPKVLKDFINSAPERRAKYLDTERKK